MDVKVNLHHSRRIPDCIAHDIPFLKLIQHFIKSNQSDWRILLQKFTHISILHHLVLSFHECGDAYHSLNIFFENFTICPKGIWEPWRNAWRKTFSEKAILYSWTIWMWTFRICSGTRPSDSLCIENNGSDKRQDTFYDMRYCSTCEVSFIAIALKWTEKAFWKTVLALLALHYIQSRMQGYRLAQR